MTAKVSTMPFWKRNASAEERFQELAIEARTKPERFTRVVVIYEEELPSQNGESYPRSRTRYSTLGCSCTIALGVMEVGKEKLLRWMFDNEE